MAKETYRSRGPLGILFASVRRRYRVFIAAGALLGLGLLAGQVWRHSQIQMRDDARYLVTAASISIPPAPPWIRTDIRMEVLRDAGLRDDLSILDPPEQLQKRLADAFAFHPWVQHVGSVRKSPPNKIEIDLIYRQPLAAVESHLRRLELVPVDRFGVRLPSQDMTDAELRYLPRILAVNSSTRMGERWQDPRVQGAVSLIDALGNRWAELHLADVVPASQPEIRGSIKYPVFELLTHYQTRIVWGAAPAASPPGEATFQTKLSRLLGYIQQNGPLNSDQVHAVIDVRNGLTTKHRTVQRDDGQSKDTKQAKKEDPDKPIQK